ncbi:aminotransferase class IV [Clostridium folliculivorans]|uniref:Branched-chain amino acid aminotransferase n=1 Tax=Clostridium folliculivorans TaxID=2886038 RepID=A0A9W5XZ29_9CLOT|nr:aminotransferase class IV [Clostridium folliculivorans]GKU23539.1 branched-chain amino acid aminotransferase [Clostridium folliculivorans]GKU29655.1 branched-chain amino acid aminotransferase [Clostridium folliculivorans]
MSECYLNKFILNGTSRVKEKFDDNILRRKGIVYEVIRVIDGVPLFLEKHLERMNNSFSLINKEMKYNKEEIKEQIETLIKDVNVFEGNIKLLMDSENDERNLLVYFVKHSYPTKDQYENGVNTTLFFGERENPNAKIVNTDFRTLVNEQISEKNSYEAILVDRNGFITEGSKSNIFMVRNDEIITSPLEDVLPGVTRGSIIDICKENNISIREEKISYKDISSLDGMFITGTSPKILPIVDVDKITLNSPKNTLILELIRLYNKKIDEYIKSAK